MRRIFLQALVLISAATVFQSINGSENIICANDEYLICVGVSAAVCASAWENAVAVCQERHPIRLEGSHAEAHEIAKQYGACASETFFSNLSSNQETLESCDKNLTATVEEYKASVLKEKQELEQRQKQLDKYLYE